MAKKKNVSVDSKHDLLLNLNPKSRFAESIKLIRTNLAFSAIDKELTTILITSAEEHDGKSFIAANLAVAYSQEGKRTLIIDCDLRQGRLHKIFEVPNGSSGGLTNLILNYKLISAKNEEKEKVEDNKKYFLNNYILPTKIEDLYIIPSGPCPPNPIELLASRDASKIFEKLRNAFDIIIFDGTPVVGLSDALVMTKYSDANIVVVCNNKTKMESVGNTVKAFDQANANITGVIMNKIDVKRSNYYGNGYYGER